MKVLVVFGTRPEAIKLAPVIQELKRRGHKSDVETVVCITAQHREMLDQAMSLFDVEADHDLDVMEAGQTLAGVASQVLARIEPILEAERPDWTVVQGDTTTVAAASLASFYADVKLAHVEAGLRTHDRRRPFPEEINRRVAGTLADLHLAPTELAMRNLVREGVSRNDVVITGNPVIDALHQVVRLPSTPETEAILKSLNSGDRRSRLVLVTAHRRENFGGPMDNIAKALSDLTKRYAGHVDIVYPVHPNPNVAGPVHRLLDGVTGVTLLPPLDYLSAAHLMNRAHIVLTDSGGIQEEAPALGKPVLVLRDVTERPEAVDAGTVKVIGTDRDRIVAEASRLLDDEAEHLRMARSVNPYGDGRASQRIVSALLGEPTEEFVPTQDRAAVESG